MITTNKELNHQIIVNILNEKYDKRTINNPSTKMLAITYISHETGINTFVINKAIDMWFDGLI